MAQNPYPTSDQSIEIGTSRIGSRYYPYRVNTEEELEE
jgi:hypothetical protein